LWNFFFRAGHYSVSLFGASELNLDRGCNLDRNHNLDRVIILTEFLTAVIILRLQSTPLIKDCCNKFWDIKEQFVSHLRVFYATN